jgi:hypothetical protein
MAPEKITVQSGLEKRFQDLNEAYQKVGGKLDFSKATEFIKKNKQSE